jgi:hypothetical protein
MKIIGIYLFLITLYSCIFSKPFIVDDNGIGIPKKDPFTLTKDPFVFPANCLLDTNKVYISMGTDRWFGNLYADTFYHYYVFFNNGYYYASKNYFEYPKITDFNQFNRGFIGSYRIEEDNKIAAEVYYPIERGRLQLRTGIIDTNKVTLTKAKDYTIFGGYDLIYVELKKIKVDSLNLTPYWTNLIKN